MKNVNRAALAALSNLLKEDLKKVTWEQEEGARIALREDPNTLHLIVALKRWATALAAVCCSYAGKYAQMHESSGAQNPAAAALESIKLVLSEHLNLPRDGTLASEHWPEHNGVRDFVLYAADVPVDIVNGDLVPRQTLPRWEPKTPFARRIAGLIKDQPQDREHATFLSVDETLEHLRGLEESFRKALLDKLGSSFNEAVLATYRTVPETGSAAEPGLPGRLQRGKDCEELVEEIEKIEHKYKRSGLAFPEIQAACASFRIFERVRMLSSEDQETFTHPGTWEPGYANLLLGKLYSNRKGNLAPATVNTWRKEYRAFRRWQEKNPAKSPNDFLIELKGRQSEYRKSHGGPTREAS
jgi:hypothetical protein